MKIEKGTSRIAIVGERTTLKLPRLQILTNIRCIRDSLKRGWLREYLTQDERHASLSRHLLGGLLANRREWHLSKKETEILVPTRFSIFGLLNIQDTATDIEMTMTAIAIKLRRKIPDEILFTQHGHTFQGSDNFGVHEGRLKLRDYGELGLEATIEKYEEVIAQALEQQMIEIQKG